MSELDSANGAPLAEPLSKRRRVSDDGVDSSRRRYGSPDDQRDSDSSPDPKSSLRRLSIRQGRPPSRSRSRSRSSGVKEDDEKRKRYRSRSPTSSRSRSRSRTPRSQRSRSRSRSYSRSQSPPSRSRSRSPRSESRSRSRSRSRTRFRSRTRSSSSRRSRRLSPSAPQPPPTAALSGQQGHRAQRKEQPLRPHYRRRLELRGHAAAVSQVRISPDGRWIASASADGTAKIWDANTGAYLNTLVGHMAGVSCLAWGPGSDTLATGSDDKAIRLWDRVTASPAHACGDGGGRGHNRTIAVSRIGSNRSGGTARGGKSGRGPLLGHHNYVYCLAFSPKGNILASGSYDEAVFLWDVRAGRLMRSLPAHSDPVSGIDFCRDGTLVVSCSTDGLIRVWDTSTGQCLRTIVHEDNPPVTNVCFSPNGRFVLAFSLDNSIRLWDYVSGSVKKTYQGHKNSSFSIGGGFGALRDTDAGGGEEKNNTPNNGINDNHKNTRTQAFVVSASEDGDIVLWDVKSKEIVQRISHAHDGVCFWVDVHGSTMVSAGKDAIIKVYRHTTKATGKGKGKGKGKGGRKKEDKARILDGVNGNGLDGHAEESSITPLPAPADDAPQPQAHAKPDEDSPDRVVKEEVEE
ncbi:WD40-repeat-containing domain protein [Diplogelasinospora grovesii]|uniref:Mitochondrial division protein 1 n=1 Tax=Diplogelasinospora grovesii TaxID=303347 RepID=A0AAN6S6Z5_9PEZI|nr:WD40-repeat-containing domain protein [Diplogelasinospora grovesii]